MDRTAITSPSEGSSTTTGRRTTVPVPRMATWGWLMMGVSNSAPRLPVLVSVNVPPASSSGATWLDLVRVAAREFDPDGLLNPGKLLAHAQQEAT